MQIGRAGGVIAPLRVLCYGRSQRRRILEVLRCGVGMDLSSGRAPDGSDFLDAVARIGRGQAYFFLRPEQPFTRDLACGLQAARRAMD